MARPYELIEHTADVFIKAYGETVADAFASAGEAMFCLMVDDSPIDAREHVQFTVQAADRESLLVRFLSELIIIHETQRLVLSDIQVTLEPDCHLSCSASGETFDETKHASGLMFKAVAYHMMEIAEPAHDHPAYVKVLFDI